MSVISVWKFGNEFHVNHHQLFVVYLVVFSFLFFFPCPLNFSTQDIQFSFVQHLLFFSLSLSLSFPMTPEDTIPEEAE